MGCRRLTQHLRTIVVHLPSNRLPTTSCNVDMGLVQKGTTGLSEPGWPPLFAMQVDNKNNFTFVCLWFPPATAQS